MIHTGLRSTSAWIGALVFGFALGLVVTYGLADTGRRPVGARLSDVAAPKDIDFQRAEGSQIPNNSGMRLASLEMPVSSGYAVADTDAPALTRPRASTADRLLPADFPASFGSPVAIGMSGWAGHVRSFPIRTPPSQELCWCAFQAWALGIAAGRAWARRASPARSLGRIGGAASAMALGGKADPPAGQGGFE